MARAPKKKSAAAARKVRVAFRRNRAKPAREKDWTRQARDAPGDELDTDSSERVVAKGDLSRKRTIIVNDGEKPAAHTGTVITIYGRIADVDDGSRVWPCTVRRVLRTRAIRDRSAVTVGDRVKFSICADREGVAAEGVIESVDPRHSELTRVTGKRAHTVVANIDQAVIVTSALTPPPKPHLVDRYIVSALYGKIEPIVCLNKIDLVPRDKARQFLKPYDKLGYATLAVSSVTLEGLDELRSALVGKSSVIAGQSGVGKSSLLNALQPGLALKIGTVVEDTAKGRHTTTRATLLKLDGGGYVVDTPGVKSFDLSCVPREQIEQFFVEFLDRIPHCKFPDCTHIHEDRCAVKEGVEQGDVTADRYESYIRLFTDTGDR